MSCENDDKTKLKDGEQQRDCLHTDEIAKKPYDYIGYPRIPYTQPKGE